MAIVVLLTSLLGLRRPRGNRNRGGGRNAGRGVGGRGYGRINIQDGGQAGQNVNSGASATHSEVSSVTETATTPSTSTSSIDAGNNIGDVQQWSGTKYYCLLVLDQQHIDQWRSWCQSFWSYVYTTIPQPSTSNTVAFCEIDNHTDTCWCLYSYIVVYRKGMWSKCIVPGVTPATKQQCGSLFGRNLLRLREQRQNYLGPQWRARVWRNSHAAPLAF